MLYKKIPNNPKRINSRLLYFTAMYQWKRNKFPSNQNVWKKIEPIYKNIALNILFANRKS